jgi:hypothetical protein
MKAITTKYFGPGNVKGSRFKASDGDNNSVTTGYDHALNSDENHIAAARKLMVKMNWDADIVSAWQANGVHVHIMVSK